MCVSWFRSTIADLPLQIELAVNTHVMVLDMHRNVATGQRGTDNQHHSVSDFLFIDNRILTIP